MDDMSIKRKNHYVWADYLRGWSDNKRDVWYSSEKGNISIGSVKGICMIKDFYRVPILTKEDVVFIYEFISEFNLDVKSEIDKIINELLKMQKLVSVYKKNFVRSEHLDKMSQSVFSNPIEDLHAAHENEAKYAISKMRSGNVSVLKEDKVMMGFVSYLAQQISRTRKAHSFIEKGGLFTLLGYFFGLQLGHALFFGKHHFFLYENDTDNSFITSSHPALNVSENPSREMDIYFPLSPKFAFGLNSNVQFKNTIVKLSEDEVASLNKKVCKQNCPPFISNSKEQLQSLKKEKLI